VIKTQQGQQQISGAFVSRRRSWDTAVGRRGTTAALAVIMLIIWDLVVRTGLVEDIIVPFPQDVASALVAEVRTPTFWVHFRVTAVEAVAGFGIGSAVGFLMGAVLGMSAWIRAVTFPYVVAFQGLPKVVLAPVFITALGFGMASKIAMAAALAFFPVLVNTMVGILTVDNDQLRVMRAYRATPWQTFRKLTLPSAAPLIFAGLKTGLTFALIGAIVGEFVGAAEGLGYLLNAYAYQLKVPQVWAVMVVLAGLGVVLYWLIQVADRKIVYWVKDRDLSSGG
jgi:NitT/TauT family transport system permease protein